MIKNLSAQEIKAEAQRLGFSACGVAQADHVNPLAHTHFERWIKQGCHATMGYLENHEEKRVDPRLLVDQAQSVISVALNYYPGQQIPANEYQLSRYAYGKDYHDVVKEKLTALLDFLQANYGTNGRAFCDTAPVLERYWAWRAGLGWIGKNTQLIIPQAGSHFFLGELIVDQPADQYDTPQPNRCGSCTRCLEACPTKALEAPHWLNANKCLSYLTIEHRGAFTPNTPPLTGNTIYGCDVCSQVCPWNRFATPTEVQEFAPSEALLQMRKEDWHTLTKAEYQQLFKGSAVKRAKYEGLMRNINALEKGTNK